MSKFEQENRKLPTLKKGDYYINEKGNWVFTSQYHLKRGYCCKSGCKHCPYGFVKKNH